MYNNKPLRNMKLREVLKEHHMYNWELAQLLGITETTLSRQLRYELPEDKLNKYISIIEEADHD